MSYGKLEDQLSPSVLQRPIPGYLQSDNRDETIFVVAVWSDRTEGVRYQDDVTDSVKYAMAQGIADPEHVCIYGSGYDGCCALAGLPFNNPGDEPTLCLSLVPLSHSGQIR